MQMALEYVAKFLATNAICLHSFNNSISHERVNLAELYLLFVEQ